MAEKRPAKEAVFSKRQLLSSDRFRDRRDALSAVLSRFPDGAKFTARAAERMLRDFYNRKAR